MAKQEREIEMLTPTTRSGWASGGGSDKDRAHETVGSSAVEFSAVETQSLIAKKRRWLPLASAAALGLVAALSMSGGPETASLPDSDSPADTDDGVGVIDPVELDSPLVDGVDVGPESLELVAPIGEFIGLRDPVLSRYGQGGPAEYSVILASPSSDLRVRDLGTGSTTRLSGQYRLVLATDVLLVGYGQGATRLSEIARRPPTSLSDDGEASRARVEALEIGDGLNGSFAAESSNEFWMVLNRSDHQVLQLRRLPEGEVIQAFETPILSWRFTGGIPIGSSGGVIYQLAPGSATGARRVADAELVDADSGRALIRTCDLEQDRCDYQWLDRANWAPLDIPTPPPDPASVESSGWRIGGGGRWLINTPNSRRGVVDETDRTNAEPLKLIDLRNGSNVSLVVGTEDSFTEFRTAALASDGNWLATSTDTELVIVNLITGDQFRSEIPADSRVVGLIRTSPELAQAATGVGADVMTLPGFERDGQRPVEASGLSILATGWLGTGAVLDLPTGESRKLDGLAETKVVNQTETETTAIGLGPSNDLVSVNLQDGSRSSRFLGAVENLAILPGPDPNQVWLGSSGPGIMNLTSGLALLDTPNLAVRERHDFRILTWHLGGADPLGTSLGSIWRYAHDNGQLDEVRSGILVTASHDIALFWECPNDSVANGSPSLDDSHLRDDAGCAFVWRSTNDWFELDLALPPNPSGVAGIYGSGRWLLIYASPTESQLVELETGRSISFGANWPDFLDVSADGRWAIHRTRATDLTLSDLDSAVYDDSGQADHDELMTYETTANRKIASVTFLATAE